MFQLDSRFIVSNYHKFIFVITFYYLYNLYLLLFCYSYFFSVIPIYIFYAFCRTAQRTFVSLLKIGNQTNHAGVSSNKTKNALSTDVTDITNVPVFGAVTDDAPVTDVLEVDATTASDGNNEDKKTSTRKGIN